MAGRKNGKEITIENSNCVKKSNELAIAKLNKGLTLTQMQLLGYCIYNTQQGNGNTFRKVDFESAFKMEKYVTPRASMDSEKLTDLKLSHSVDLENDKFKYWNVFGGIEYEKGLFEYEWTSRMLQHITNLEDNYLATDLTVVSNFNSSFSWTLYDYLKANYGCWYKTLSKQATMNLFGVESKKSYQNNTGLLKKYVVDVAIEEINKYTELEVKCESVLDGRSIVGFKITWSTGKVIQKASEKQMEALRTIVDTVIQDIHLYNKIEDTDNREKVLDVFRTMCEIKTLYFEDEVGMSSELYITTYTKANGLLEKLNHLLVQSGEEPIDAEVPMYDWLNK